jgi:hypothetical protein
VGVACFEKAMGESSGAPGDTDTECKEKPDGWRGERQLGWAAGSQELLILHLPDLSVFSPGAVCVCVCVCVCVVA